MPGSLMFLNAFTWSQAKDNSAGSLEKQYGNTPGPQDFYNMEADYSISGYNQPYNNTTSVVWDLPFGHASNLESAVAEYEQIVRIDSTDRTIQMNLARLYLIHTPDKAVAMYEIQGTRITRVWFIFGAKTFDPKP